MTSATVRKLVALAVLLLVCGLARPAAVQAQDASVAMRLQGFVAALNARDVQAVVGFYARDAALFPPQAGHLVGRDQIARHYAAAFQAGLEGLDARILELRQLGPDAVVAIGATTIRAGGQAIAARFLHIWRSEDGQWVISRDIYNVIGPA